MSMYAGGRTAVCTCVRERATASGPPLVGSGSRVDAGWAGDARRYAGEGRVSGRA